MTLKATTKFRFLLG